MSSGGFTSVGFSPNEAKFEQLREAVFSHFKHFYARSSNDTVANIAKHYSSPDSPKETELNFN